MTNRFFGRFSYVYRFLFYSWIVVYLMGAAMTAGCVWVKCSTPHKRISFAVGYPVFTKYVRFFCVHVVYRLFKCAIGRLLGCLPHYMWILCLCIRCCCSFENFLSVVKMTNEILVVHFSHIFCWESHETPLYRTATLLDRTVKHCFRPQNH